MDTIVSKKCLEEKRASDRRIKNLRNAFKKAKTRSEILNLYKLATIVLRENPDDAIALGPMLDVLREKVIWIQLETKALR